MTDATTGSSLSEPATAADVHQQITEALTSGLPGQTVTVYYWLQAISIHTSPETWEEWRRWWNQHGAGPWTTTSTPVGGLLHMSTVGHWRGWTVEIVHVSKDGAAR